MHRPKKRFGQHFLADAGIIQRIITTIAPEPSQHLIEIGPGRGVITLPLLQAVGKLEAIELDRDLIAGVRVLCLLHGDLNLHQADALQFDYGTLQNDTRQLRLVGNLPYNISTPLLFHLLTYKTIIQDMHFMLQKEVVERMAAKPGNKTYSRLSVMIQDACQVESLFDIRPTAFNPPPRVDSSFVRLIPKPNPAHTPEHQAAFAKIVSQSFSQRRKTLRNNLKNYLTEAQIEANGINPQTRAETINLVDFHRLAATYATTRHFEISQ
jgi:16S rRNA (adenine1518-N6/adenine1519-N6)-dimethyltransferase